MNANEAAAAADLGQPTARKAGRDSRWPYVPVIATTPTESCPKGFTQQIKGLAYATRDEAVQAAERHISAQRVRLSEQLAKPNMRALRAQYGVEG